MNFKLSQVLQWARRVRDFLLGRAIKSDVAELDPLRKELDEVVEQLTVNASTQESITKQSRVQTTEIVRLRTALRDRHMKPIVRMSQTMTFDVTGADILFVLPYTRMNSERLAATGDAMVAVLKTVGPQFVARGFAADFVDQLSNATKALRDAVDQRSAQVSRRTGTTAAMDRDQARAVQLVRLIDALVRPAIEKDQELLAAWENVIQLRVSSSTKPASAPVTTSAAPALAPAPTATAPTTSAEVAQSQKSAA
jgi:hypothetical protein